MFNRYHDVLGIRIRKKNLFLRLFITLGSIIIYDNDKSRLEFLTDFYEDNNLKMKL